MDKAPDVFFMHSKQFWTLVSIPSMLHGDPDIWEDLNSNSSVSDRSFN